MAIEDAVTLAECLERAKITDDIPKYLRAFQQIREPRCRLIQDYGAAQAHRATLPDGPEQKDRDKRFKANNTFTPQSTWDGVHIDQVPESFNDPEWTPWLFGHNAFAFVSFVHLHVARL
jgi:salicylate hydroxylase